MAAFKLKKATPVESNLNFLVVTHFQKSELNVKAKVLVPLARD